MYPETQKDMASSLLGGGIGWEKEHTSGVVTPDASTGKAI